MFDIKYWFISNMNKTLLAFFFFCLPARSLLAWYAYSIREKEEKITLALITFVIAISWLFMFNLNFREAWWNGYRSVHALNYLAYAILTYMNYPFAYLFLVIDVLLGALVVFLQYNKEIWSWFYYTIYQYISGYNLKIERVK